jgi:hypothetical protein
MTAAGAGPEAAPEPMGWVEIVLIGEDGAPLGDVRYSLTLLGGQIREGTLGDKS